LRSAAPWSAAQADAASQPRERALDSPLRWQEAKRPPKAQVVDWSFFSYATTDNLRPLLSGAYSGCESILMKGGNRTLVEI
jgi:hypothetical protein